MNARRGIGEVLSFETLFRGVPAFAGSLSFLLLFPSVSPASDPPPPPIGAGQILQEIQPVQPRTSPPSSVFPPVRIRVRRIRITGSRIVPAPVLEKAASPWEGKTLGEGDLRAMLGTLTETLHRRGDLSGRAILPRRALRSGTLTVRIVEAPPGSGK